MPCSHISIARPSASPTAWRALRADAAKYSKVGRPAIVHLKSSKQAQALGPEQKPYHIVGTYWDENYRVRVVEVLLQRRGKGGFLEICFNPKRTR